MKKLSEIEITEEMKEKASKCTTAEEITALAQQYDVELTQEEISDILKSNTVKELSENDLNQIAGGDTHAERTCKYLPKDHGKFIEHYTEEPYFGQKVYVVDDGDREIFFAGTLIRSYEKDNDCNTTERTHEVFVDEVNNYWRATRKYSPGKTYEFLARLYSLYLYR